jgi:hypothetical protein
MRHSDQRDIVTDGVGGGVCGSWGKGSHLGSRGGPARQEGEKAGSWLRTVEEKRHNKMVKDAGDRLATPSRDVYAQRECCCALYSSYTVYP